MNTNFLKLVGSLKMRQANIASQIKKMKQFRKLIRDIKKNTSGEGYLAWCEHKISSRLTKLRVFSVVPASFGGAKLIAFLEKNQLSDYDILYDMLLSNPDICKDKKFILRDIILPVANEKSECWAFASVIQDTLLPYLLEEYFAEKNFQSLYPALGTEWPYEYGNVTLKAGDIVIDAGSHIGAFSALASVRGCKSYAFEPIPYNINYLSKTAEWNKNIEICNYALSDNKSDITFNVFEGLNGVADLIRKCDKPAVTVMAKAIDLDSFVQENKLSSVDFIKADIEGAERLMLKGAKNVLKEFSPKIAICTYHLPDDPKILRELILDANPNYVIEEKPMKMYAHVPK